MISHRRTVARSAVHVATAVVFLVCCWAPAALAQRAPLPPRAASQPTETGFPDLDARRPPPNVEVLRRVESTARLVMVSSLLFIVFALTAYMLLRRRPSRDDGPAPRTQYVDAWAAYRLNPDSIAAATIEPADDEERPRRPGPDHPPRQRPDSSDPDLPPDGGKS